MTFQLPQGWKLLTVSELAGLGGVVADGDWIESKDQDPNGDVRLIQLADIGVAEFLDRSHRFLTSLTAGRLQCTMLQPGDLLIARMPDPLGRACLFPGVGQPSVTAVDVFIWRSGKNAADARWLMHAINSPEVREHLQNIAGGTTRQRVSGGNLKRLALPTPPKAMQHHIVTTLDSLLSRSKNAWNELNHIPKLVERYRQAYLHQIFDRLGNIGRPLRDLIASGPQNGLYLPKSCYGSGTPILRIENFDLNSVQPIENWRCVRVPDGTDGKYNLSLNDILVNRVNSPSHLGKSMIVRDGHVPSVFESNMMRFSVITAVLPEYLQAFLSCDQGRGLLIKDAKWAVNQASINQDDVCNTMVPVPDLNTQMEIIERIDQVNRWSSTILSDTGKASDLSRRLETALLSKAFRGELVRVDVVAKLSAAE